MKVDTIQTSFTGGEFGPPLWGRTDIEQYNNACAIVQNFLIRPFGSVISTPGTQYINACKTGGVTTLSGVRTIPFVFSQTDSYIIELGVGYFRFYTNGAVVVSSGTTPYEVSHNYQAADISSIQYCQFNDVIYLTHANYPPATLTRMGATNWVFSNLSFTGGPFMPANATAITLQSSATASGSTTSVTVSIPTWASGTVYSVGQYILSGSTLYQCVVANTAGGALSVTGSATSFADSSSAGTVAWKTTTNTVTAGSLTITSHYLLCTGFGFALPTNATINGLVATIQETASAGGKIKDNSVKLLTSSTLTGTEHALTSSWANGTANVTYGTTTDTWGITISAANVNNSGFGLGISVTVSHSSNAVVNSVQFQVYYTLGGFSNDLAAGYWQVANSIFQAGHVGSFWSLGATTTNSTTGLAVQGYFQITNYVSATAVTGTVISLLSTAGATTAWAEGSWSSVRGWPARCAFFQSRFFMARTNSEPQTVWGSQNFIYTNFSVNGGADDDALNLQLSATQSNDIKWLSPMNDLLVGTYGGEFAISAGIGTGNPLTPATAGVSWQTPWGSEAFVPKRIGNFIYYIQRYFQKIREVFYIWTSANYKSVDKTILSPQICGGGFIDMAYQQNPDTVLWLVCSNGTIATLTREVDQEVQAWSRQVTAGTYSSIASIPSQTGAYDEVWVIVQRTINGSQVNYIERFSNQILPTKGDFVTVQADQLNYVHCGLTYSAFSANTTASISLSSTSGVITITSSAAYFSAGQVGNRIRIVDAYDTSQGEGIINAFTSSTVINVSVTTTFLSTASVAGLWGVSVTSISGNGQLEQATVVALGDGTVISGTFVVSNGTITLASDYFVVTIGLQVTQKLLTLAKEAGAQRGTAQGKVQRIANVGFKLNNSYQGFSISGTTGTLQQVVTSNSTLFTGVKPNISFGDDYRRGSQILIQNSDPLPIEILSIMAELDTHER